MVAALWVAGVLCACGDVARQPVLQLVHVPKAALAELTSVGAEASVLAPAAVGWTGTAAYARAADIEEFVAACEALQPAAVEGLEERASRYGEIYRGERPAPDLGPAPADGVFRYVESEAEYMDPNLIAEGAGTNLAANLFEGLMVYAPGNEPARYGCAQRHDVSEDGRTWTFTLREGLLWSDGAPLTAEDFRYSWLRALDPALGSRNAQQLWPIVGAREFNQGRTDDPATVAVRVRGPRVLELELVAPTPYLLELLAYIAFAPVPRHAIEAHGADWVRPAHMVVNGPYRLEAWRPRDRMVFVRNPRYWDAANVRLERAVALLTDDAALNLRLYEGGEVHWIRPIPFESVRHAIRDGRSDLHVDQEMCTYYYAFNLERPPFDHPDVRRAFDLAVDKERLVRHVLAGFQVPARGLVPDMFRAMLGYVPPQQEGYDPARARELLARAGFPGGAGLPPIEIVYNTFETHRQIAEFVQRNLSENLGVAVSVHNVEWKSLLKETRQGGFQIARASWCKDYPDPMTFLTVYHSEGENNYARYRNPAYDALLGRIAGTTGVRVRNVLMCAAEKVLGRDLPFLSFYFYTRPYLLRPFVRGFEPQYGDDHLLKYLWLDPSGPRAEGG